MEFYNTNTPEQKRAVKLTGDVNINDMFRKECETRGIPIYNAYNIQKRLLHEVDQEQIIGVDKVDERLMELLDEKSKNKVTHRYVDFISDDSTSPKGIIPPRGDSGLPPLNQIKIPPRARDGKTFNVKNEADEKDMLKEIMLQNKKIINQNKIIIDKLEKLGEKYD